MKKHFLIVFFAIIAISCSKKTEIKGKITGASPTERIEIIEGSGVGTLPLINMGVNDKGEFSGTFEALKSGMYVISYAGKMNMVYIKKGQSLDISGNNTDFPEKITITGDAKNNNDFINDSQNFFKSYAEKLNIQQILTANETDFLKEFDKIKSDLTKNLEETAKKDKADNDVLTWKKNELYAKLLGLLSAYKQQHGALTNNPNFKVSANYSKKEESMVTDKDLMIEELPVYRDYLLGNLFPDYQKYAQAQNVSPEALTSESFSKFLETKKDFSQKQKDYLLAYVMAQTDVNPMKANKVDDINKLIDTNIKDADVKNNLKSLVTVIMGLKVGTPVPAVSLVKEDGKKVSSSDLKDKPTFVVFYASWSPNLSQQTLDAIKEIAQYYKAKVNFAYINLDDNEALFKKTSKGMFGSFPGVNYYAPDGLNSDLAKKFSIYGFKMPSYLIISADNKIASRPYYQIDDPQIPQDLEKLTGIKPMASALMPNPQLAPPPVQNQQPQQQPQPAR